MRQCVPARWMNCSTTVIALPAVRTVFSSGEAQIAFVLISHGGRKRPRRPHRRLIMGSERVMEKQQHRDTAM